MSLRSRNATSIAWDPVYVWISSSTIQRRSAPSREATVARKKEDVFEHRIVGDEDMRGRVEHFRATEQPIARCVIRIAEVGPKDG